MRAKYFLRFDDACPTMDKAKWERVENLCDHYNIKPIVAVIPDNRDPFLMRNDYDESFWSKVRSWQSKGWYIALHGYDHQYISEHSGIVPFNQRSEFAGLDLNDQIKKIQAGLLIFKNENIKTKIWVAPSHSFDKNTLKALSSTPITIISDGIALKAFEEFDFYWIPQQLWRFRKMPFGTWTGCFHPNDMVEQEFNQLEQFIHINSEYFPDIETLRYSPKSILDKIFENMYWFMRLIKNKFSK